jgi:hypothetical protein
MALFLLLVQALGARFCFICLVVFGRDRPSLTNADLSARRGNLLKKLSAGGDHFFKQHRIFGSSSRVCHFDVAVPPLTGSKRHCYSGKDEKALNLMELHKDGYGRNQKPTAQKRPGVLDAAQNIDPVSE